MPSWSSPSTPLHLANALSLSPLHCHAADDICRHGDPPYTLPDIVGACHVIKCWGDADLDSRKGSSRALEPQPRNVNCHQEARFRGMLLLYPTAAQHGSAAVSECARSAATAAAAVALITRASGRPGLEESWGEGTDAPCQGGAWGDGGEARDSKKTTTCEAESGVFTLSDVYFGLFGGTWNETSDIVPNNTRGTWHNPEQHASRELNAAVATSQVKTINEYGATGTCRENVEFPPPAAFGGGVSGDKRRARLLAKRGDASTANANICRPCAIRNNGYN
ncbi:unnamed protein product [Lampetra fluviatilis]